ncbi:spore germination protein GerPE [Rossellomorea aquimaris]|uniref:spore germination protein GerPE n=1 Tax=Rossellomorea aquimaris TaxID=189382 RepID=UPI001CD66530|nr:spore germination protein GerPE [Rossellomorea aquimaris]MCA1056415.1 spore germination protein GerPE [Rossellomorea aquimaris]
MLKRYSIVNELSGVTLSFSSVYQLGDSQNIFSTTKAFAVQREKEFFLSSEGRFDSDVFNKPIELPPPNPRVTVNRLNLAPIKVNCLKIRATAFSSIVHIGNTCNVYMDSRVKNVRQLEGEAEYTEEEMEAIQEMEFPGVEEGETVEFIQFED